ncbi:MAG: glycosyl hydrolase family 59 [Ruminiclostridium sp.]|nr:glycosyl hydrolase family 59 [Ruminiclostridium sp.]
MLLQHEKNHSTYDTQAYYVIKIDGNTINQSENTVFRGLGAISGNNSSRLLMDYKVKNPESYWRIMNLLFKPDYGAGLSHIKIEFGSDVNSSSGTEPSIMRTEDEKADVTRGAGFTIAADALSINPDITIDLLRWSEPLWVTNAFKISKEEGYKARYKWYKAAIDNAYDIYGIKFTHISADANETSEADADWIIYFSKALKSEIDSRYDYSKIKIIASDEIGSWTVSKAMIENEELRNSVDIIGGHYSTWTDENTKKLNTVYGKEIWYSEGIASTNISKLAVNSNKSGINGVNGALDVCNRIINGYYNGKMTAYEYQPAVAAYYSGVKYFPKSLINAQNPWSGYFEADCGIWTSAHFTYFIKNGWRYIDSACFGDGKENHSITDTTNNYMTATDIDSGDYSVVICNDSDKPRYYSFVVENMKKAASPVYVWETRGPDDNQEYDENYFRIINMLTPVAINEQYHYSLCVKPFSIITVTTLKKQADKYIHNCSCKDIPLDINYSDSFGYSDEFLSARGNAPLYTTDYGGAFEVEKVNNSKVLMQKITADNKPVDWRYRTTPFPITSLGDDRWCNYSAMIDFKLADSDESNYVSFAVRYLVAEADTIHSDNGYTFRIHPSGKWLLNKNTSTVAEGIIKDFDYSIWHTIKITANKKLIHVYSDDVAITEFADEKGYAHSGRVAIGSGLFNNIFDNLRIYPIENAQATVTRLDDHDSAISYKGRWTRTVPDSYLNFNRTTSRSEEEDAEMEFNFIGNHFAIIGKTENAVIEVFIDGNFFETIKIEPTDVRQCSYSADISYDNHSVLIKVKSGNYTVDAIEY